MNEEKAVAEVEVRAVDGDLYKLSTGPGVPHLIHDGIDVGPATVAEEAFWAEIGRLRDEGRGQS
jgi:hypothetical protein